MATAPAERHPPPPSPARGVTATGAPPARASRTATVGVMAMIGARLAARAFSIVLVIVLARHLSPESFAAYSYLIALAVALAAVMDPGVGVTAGREVSSGALALATAYRNGALAVSLGALLAAGTTAAVGLLDSGPGSSGWPLVFITMFIGVNALFNFQTGLLRGAGRLGLEAGLQVGASLGLVAAALVAVALGGGLTAVMGSFAAVESGVVLLTQAFLPPAWAAGRVPGLAWHLVRSGLLVSLGVTVLAVLTRVSLITASNAWPARDAADFAVAYRFAETGLLLAQALALAVLPQLGAHFAASPAFGNARGVRVLLTALGAAVVCGALGVLLAPDIVTLAFGERYRAAGAASQLLVAMLPVATALWIGWAVLTAMGREGAVLLAAVVGLAAAVATTPWIVADPRLIVAAAATAISLGVTALALLAAWLWAARRMRPGAAPA